MAESEAIKSLIDNLDEQFIQAVDLCVNCTGRVIVSGMGKAGLIGQKISATFASTGTPSYSLHPADALHGDLGRIHKDDVVLCLSNSGKTEEIIRLIRPVKKIGTPIIALTGGKTSPLAKDATVVLNLGKQTEAGPMGLAPTTSSICMLALGDALAMAVLAQRDFGPKEFGFFHPAGSLGQSLMAVGEIMRTGQQNPIIGQDHSVREALLAITEARAGAISIVDTSGKLVGLFTDGDLRRAISNEPNVDAAKISDVMTSDPLTIKPDDQISEALRILQEWKIDELPVVNDDDEPVGMIDVQDLLSVGLLEPSETLESTESGDA